MAIDKDKPTDIDSYIASFPEETQKLLKQMRTAIQKAAPDAMEKISYGMPTFFLQGNLVYFAGYKNHIGFYPTSSGITDFCKELSPYAGAKGSVQFPLDQPLPLTTISKIVKFRVSENLGKSAKNIKKNPVGNFASILSKPAQRALANAGVKT